MLLFFFLLREFDFFVHFTSVGIICKHILIFAMNLYIVCAAHNLVRNVNKTFTITLCYMYFMSIDIFLTDYYICIDSNSIFFFYCVEHFFVKENWRAKSKKNMISNRVVIYLLCHLNVHANTNLSTLSCINKFLLITRRYRLRNRNEMCCRFYFFYKYSLLLSK